MQKCSVDGNIQNVENVILDDEAELCLVSGSLKNIEVKNKASLNLTEYDESIFVEIKGNFIYSFGSICGRRIKTWYDQSDRTRNFGNRRINCKVNLYDEND